MCTVGAFNADKDDADPVYAKSSMLPVTAGSGCYQINRGKYNSRLQQLCEPISRLKAKDTITCYQDNIVTEQYSLYYFRNLYNMAF